jgi:hypothetical protein
MLLRAFLLWPLVPAGPGVSLFWPSVPVLLTALLLLLFLVRLLQLPARVVVAVVRSTGMVLLVRPAVALVVQARGIQVLVVAVRSVGTVVGRTV